MIIFMNHLVCMGNFPSLSSLMIWLPLSLCMTLVCVAAVRYVMNANALSAILVNDPPFTNPHPPTPAPEYPVLVTIPEAEACMCYSVSVVDTY